MDWEERIIGRADPEEAVRQVESLFNHRSVGGKSNPPFFTVLEEAQNFIPSRWSFSNVESGNSKGRSGYGFC